LEDLDQNKYKTSSIQKDDSTKCFYFTVEEVEHLFGSVGGLDVMEGKYLRRIYENTGTGQRRRRIWVQGRFKKAYDSFFLQSVKGTR
jgi:hypothetical protein